MSSTFRYITTPQQPKKSFLDFKTLSSDRDMQKLVEMVINGKQAQSEMQSLEKQLTSAKERWTTALQKGNNAKSAQQNYETLRQKLRNRKKSLGDWENALLELEHWATQSAEQAISIHALFLQKGQNAIAGEFVECIAKVINSEKEELQKLWNFRTRKLGMDSFEAAENPLDRGSDAIERICQAAGSFNFLQAMAYSLVKQGYGQDTRTIFRALKEKNSPREICDLCIFLAEKSFERSDVQFEVVFRGSQKLRQMGLDGDADVVCEALAESMSSKIGVLNTSRAKNVALDMQKRLETFYILSNEDEARLKALIGILLLKSECESLLSLGKSLLEAREKARGTISEWKYKELLQKIVYSFELADRREEARQLSKLVDEKDMAAMRENTRRLSEVVYEDIPASEKVIALHANSIIREYNTLMGSHSGDIIQALLDKNKCLQAKAVMLQVLERTDEIAIDFPEMRMRSFYRFVDAKLIEKGRQKEADEITAAWNEKCPSYIYRQVEAAQIGVPTENIKFEKIAIRDDVGGVADDLVRMLKFYTGNSEMSVHDFVNEAIKQGKYSLLSEALTELLRREDEEFIVSRLGSFTPEKFRKIFELATSGFHASGQIEWARGLRGTWMFMHPEMPLEVPKSPL